jgi:hypothetical protein
MEAKVHHRNYLVVQANQGNFFLKPVVHIFINTYFLSIFVERFHSTNTEGHECWFQCFVLFFKHLEGGKKIKGRVLIGLRD